MMAVFIAQIAFSIALTSFGIGMVAGQFMSNSKGMESWIDWTAGIAAIALILSLFVGTIAMIWAQ